MKSYKGDKYSDIERIRFALQGDDCVTTQNAAERIEAALTTIKPTGKIIIAGTADEIEPNDFKKLWDNPLKQ